MRFFSGAVSMPKIINYLAYVSTARSYDEIELARLQLVYERACRAHGIEVGDPRRETIAMLVFQVADLTRHPDEMLERVMAMLQRPS